MLLSAAQRSLALRAEHLLLHARAAVQCALGLYCCLVFAFDLNNSLLLINLAAIISAASHITPNLYLVQAFSLRLAKVVHLQSVYVTV
jgi:hypothetical protein